MLSVRDVSIRGAATGFRRFRRNARYFQTEDFGHAAGAVGGIFQSLLKRFGCGSQSALTWLLQFEPWSGLPVRQIHSNLIGTTTGLPSAKLVRTARHFIYDSTELHPISLRTHFGLVDSVHPEVAQFV